MISEASLKHHICQAITFRGQARRRPTYSDIDITTGLSARTRRAVPVCGDDRAQLPHNIPYMATDDSPWRIPCLRAPNISTVRTKLTPKYGKALGSWFKWQQSTRRNIHQYYGSLDERLERYRASYWRIAPFLRGLVTRMGRDIAV